MDEFHSADQMLLCAKPSEPIVTAEQLMQSALRPVYGTVLAEEKSRW